MTTEQDQSTTEDRPNKATSSTTDRPIASGDGRSASFAVSGPDSPATDDSNDSGPYIDDIAPRRTRDFGDLTRAGLSLLMAAVVMVFAVYLGGMTRGVESDAHTAAQAINWLAAFPSTVLTQLATTVIVVIVLAQLLLAREWLQAAVSALAMFAGYGIVWVISTAISSLNDFTLQWHWSQPPPHTAPAVARHLRRHGVLPDRRRATPYPLHGQMELEYPVCHRRGDGGAFVAFGYRHAGFDGRRSHGGHAYPIRGRHAE